MSEDLEGVRDEVAAKAKPRPVLKVVTPDAPPPASGWLSATSIDAITFPLASFKGLTSTRPAAQQDLDWPGVVSNVAPTEAPVVAEKKNVLYFMAGTLRSAPLVGKTLQYAQAKGQSEVGVMRSKSHVEMVGPAIVLDVDKSVFKLEESIKALGCSSILYSSHSFGMPQSDGVPKDGGRVVLAGDRQWTPAEHLAVIAAITDILKAPVDPNAVAYSQCFGVHATQPGAGKPRRIVLGGGTLSIDKLLEHGKKLLPAELEPRDLSPHVQRQVEWKHALAAEGVPSVDWQAVVSAAHYLAATGYFDSKEKRGSDGEWAAWRDLLWMLAVIAVQTPALEIDVRQLVGDLVVMAGRDFERNCGSNTVKGRIDEAIERAVSEKHLDSGRGSFFKAADDNGWSGKENSPLWRAKSRAEGVLDALYSGGNSASATNVVSFPDMGALPAAAQAIGAVTDELGAGIKERVTANVVDPNTLKRSDAVWACDFLMSCFKNVWEAVERRHAIPADVVADATKRSTERALQEQLQGRIPFRWDNQASTDEQTKALAVAIMNSGVPLYHFGQNYLVLVGDPTTDQWALQDCRDLYGYTGAPGGPEDPSNYLGVGIVPITIKQKALFKVVLSRYLVEEFDILLDPKAKIPEYLTLYNDFSFKRVGGPNDDVLEALITYTLPLTARRLRGLVTAPTMPTPPQNGSFTQISLAGSERIVDKPGYDLASGVFYAPIGVPVSVPATVSREQALSALGEIKAVFSDFPFASTVDEVGPEAGRAVAVGMTIAGVIRQGMELCPGVAVTTPDGHQGTGKTQLAQSIAAPGYGSFPSPRSLPTNFEEQDKVVTTALRTGTRALLFDNLPANMQWDGGALAGAMSSDTFTSRVLGVSEEAHYSTRTLIAATGNALNTSGDVASRFLVIELNSGLERPDDRTGFKIESLKRHAILNRQRLVAACLTVLRGYAEHCRNLKKIPDEVVAARAKEGTRFPAVEVIRDALLWLDMDDMLLGSTTAASKSGSKDRDNDLYDRLERVMVAACGPSLEVAAMLDTKNRSAWDKQFDQNWNALTVSQQIEAMQTTNAAEARSKAFAIWRNRKNMAYWLPKVRTGAKTFTSAELLTAMMPNGVPSETLAADLAVLVETMARRSGRLTERSLGMYLSHRLVGKICGGRVLRAQKSGLARYWIAEV